MQRRAVNSELGALFSPAIVVGDLVFTSGQVGWVPETRDLPEGIKAQTAQTMENLKAVLEAAGSSLDKVVKVQVYLTNMDNFPAMNEVYRGYFPTEPPARTTVGNATLARPDFLIEIDMVALRD
jgi:2-iminobutanoate/2-iminopropanoate deaminase